MNHSAAVCRQCSKAYTDIGDGKPYCAECLLTMSYTVESTPEDYIQVLAKLEPVADVIESPRLRASIDAVGSWLTGGEYPYEAATDVMEALMGLLASSRYPIVDESGSEWNATEVTAGIDFLGVLQRGSV